MNTPIFAALFDESDTETQRAVLAARVRVAHEQSVIGARAYDNAFKGYWPDEAGAA